jgi:hypothetical protein
MRRSKEARKSSVWQWVAVSALKRTVVLQADGGVIFNLAPVAIGMAEVYEESFASIPVQL